MKRKEFTELLFVGMRKGERLPYLEVLIENRRFHLNNFNILNLLIFPIN